MSSIDTNYSLVQAFFGSGANATNSVNPVSSVSSISDYTLYGSNTAKLAGQSDISEYLTSVKSGAKTLTDSIKSLLAKTNSAFDQRTAVSSDTNIIGVKSGSIKAGSKSAEEVYKIEVAQLAQTQKNEGNAISSTSKDFSSDRYYGFSIESNGKSNDFSFSVNEKDTNEDVLKKMAKDINDRGIGVKANVVYDAFNKQSTLVLESEKSGQSQEGSQSDLFTVKARTGYADAAEIAGIKDVDQKAQNAQYRINGSDELKTSQSNDIALSNGSTVTLKGTGTASIASEKDSLTAINTTREMVNGFNKLLDAAKSLKDSDSGAKRLYDTLNGLAETYTKSLSEIGIGINENGFLTIDEAKMKEAGTNGKLESFFKDNGNSNFGFANRLSRVASSANSDSSNYLGVSSKETLKASESSYSSKNNNDITFNPYQMNRMANYSNIGMLFDSMF